MLDGLLRGSAADLVTTLIETQRVSREEIGEIQRMIDAHDEGSDDDE